MAVRKLLQTDLQERFRLRRLFWPNASADLLRAQMSARMFPAERVGTYVWQRSGGDLGGFIEVSWSEYHSWVKQGRVASIEACYVDTDVRRQGIARELLKAAERWALEMQCLEIISNIDSANLLGRKACKALGLWQSGQFVTFRKYVDT